MNYIHIDALEVARKFGHLIKGRGKISGLEFAKLILKSSIDCKEHRETCASSVASSVYEIEIRANGSCMTKELLLKHTSSMTKY